MSTEKLLDQASGDLTLHTGRAGVGSKVGHDLTLRVRQWSARAQVEDDGTVSRVRLVAVLSSLEVLRGDGGLKALSDKDKATILGNALETLQAKDFPEVLYEAGDLTLPAGESIVQGQVTIAGTTRPLTIEAFVHRNGDDVRVQVRGQILQSTFGIRPYSGMLGALKVRDLVEIKADLLAVPS